LRMPTNSDLKLSFAFYRAAGKLKVIPAQFFRERGSSGWEMRRETSAIKRFGFGLWVVVVSCHLSGIALRTLGGEVSEFKVPRELLVLSLLAMEIFGTGCFMAFVLFHKSLDLNMKLFNEMNTLRGKTMQIPPLFIVSIS
jgi:hypothetical protein